MNIEDAHRDYAAQLAEVEKDDHARRHWMRRMCQNDIFYLLYYVLNREDIGRQWLFERCNEVQDNPDGYIDLWAREHYKALDTETPVLTVRGWKKHGNLRPGDKIFSPDGRIVRVLANSGPMLSADCYLVGGIVAAGDHLWPVQTKHRTRIVGGREVYYTTELTKTRSMFKKRLPNIKPLQGYGSKTTIIPPYVLGAWLGNGHSSCGRITHGDSEFWNIIPWKTKGQPKSITKNLCGLMPLLRKMGVLNNKHIPPDYLLSPLKARLLLLQGLMDTDGHINTRGTATFCNTNENIIDGVAHLARSLGMRSHKRRYEVAGQNGYWQVSFQAYRGDYCPFRLQRKAARCKPGCANMRRYTATPVLSRPVNCIQVERGNYLAGTDLIPTHNSTIITYALTIQEILKDPEITVGLFSHVRPIAKSFLRQIKREFEDNVKLKYFFPEILWKNPKAESPKWSEDDGIIVQRNGNPKEATIEAYGLVDGMPVGKHYRLRVYDDVVTQESVTTPEMMEKTTRAWELSLNLGTEGGAVRYIGTRYHLNDTYRTIMERGAATPRIYPATGDGKITGEPVLLQRETLTKKRNDMGPYVYSCLPPDAPILMADFSERNIGDIVAGDVVVGYVLGDINHRTNIVKSRVIATNKSSNEIYEILLESGRIARCTKDHKWYTGRSGNDTHKAYSVLKNKGHMVSMYNPTIFKPSDNNSSAMWLSGFYDGEGSLSGDQIHFHQSNKYPAILNRLRENLYKCGFDFGETINKRPNRYDAHDVYIRGGKQEHLRFLHICNPAKKEAVVNSIFKRDTRVFNNGKNRKEKIVDIKYIGKSTVINIQTETGNYIAYGYASKNCQMMQNPVADAVQSFKPDWLRFWPADTTGGMNIYLICDPAGDKKRKGNDYTVFMVIGLGSDRNFYIIDMVRDRLNLGERASILFRLHETYRPLATGYEQYGMMADSFYIREQQKLKNYRFDFIELGGKMPKNDRIRRLVPMFEAGRVYLPHSCIKANYEGVTQNLTDVFIKEEYEFFPVSVHDDMLDAMSRILDEDMPAMFPLITSGKGFTPKRKTIMQRR